MKEAELSCPVWLAVENSPATASNGGNGVNTSAITNVSSKDDSKTDKRREERICHDDQRWALHSVDYFDSRSSKPNLFLPEPSPLHSQIVAIYVRIDYKHIRAFRGATIYSLASSRETADSSAPHTPLASP